MNEYYKKKYFIYNNKYMKIKKNKIIPYSHTFEDTFFYYNKEIENFDNTNYNESEGNLNKKNILGTPLIPCCITGKITGFYRDGVCSTGPTDSGTHVVCAVVDDKFLQFTKSKGNDLITPIPNSFPGLISGDKWCLCILRWIEAYNAGVAPKIIAESTNQIAEKYIDKRILLQYSI